MMDILEYEKPDGMKCREDLMLYALLNAGAPYLVRDGAYENTDGSFAGCGDLGPEETAERDLLRQQYIAAVRRNLTAQLEDTYIVEPDGTKHKLGRRETEETEQ